MTQQNLKQKTISGRSVVLLRVPARDARHIQTHLAALISGPLAKAMATNVDVGEMGSKLQQMAKGAGIGIEALALLLDKLDSGDLDKLIVSISPFVRIDGDQLDENKQFDADTLLDLYEVIGFFLWETFQRFFVEIRSRFPQIEKLKALIQSKVPTSTGTSGVPA